MKKKYFVTGTDTGVGKSLIAATFLYAAKQAGLAAFGLKPLAAGCEDTSEGLQNDDALLLQKNASIQLAYQQVNPMALKLPIAPHIAASEAGLRLSVDRLEGYCRGAMMRRYDLCLVEGAGGWRVPLNESENLSGLVQKLKLPVILVVGVRLGCLNHALLTAEAIARDGVEIAGWVANSAQKEMDFELENIETLKYRLPFTFLGHVPFLSVPSVENISKYLNVKEILT